MTDKKEGNLKKGEVNTSAGNKYTLQHPGVKWYLGLIDRNKNRNGVLQYQSYVNELLEYVVIEEVDFEDFKSVGELEELVNEIEQFFRA